MSVSWHDVVKWCNAASERDGLSPCYTVNGGTYKVGYDNDVQCNWNANGYRLPTEAEWEVAARGGLTGRRFPWGDTISQNQANYTASRSVSYDATGQSLASWADFPHPLYGGGATPNTSPVGSFAANGYGLNDMAGNVWQWCWDWYGGTYPAGSNPHGAASGYERVVRGGAWYHMASILRCGKRPLSGFNPSAYPNEAGFRLVRGGTQ